jgi:hypothetical protein
VFHVQRGKVLGCLVSVKGIEANPDKINAIVHMKHPQSKKQVQKLTDRIAALNWFMSKLTEQSLPLFRMLRGSNSFHRGPEQQKAFDEFKTHIQKLPTLSSPQPDQPLILYVSVSQAAVSGALVQEKETTKEDKKISHQVLIYYVVVMSAWKLCHYYEAHRVRVLTN